MTTVQPEPIQRHPDGMTYIVYDHRGIPPGDTDDAQVMEANDSLKELRRAWRGYGYPVYRVTIKNGVGEDETFVEIIR